MIWYFLLVEGKYVDDISGLPLTLSGRHDELSGFDTRMVYEFRPRQWAIDHGIQVIGTRWVDKQTGAKVRSSLVAQDFNFSKGKSGPDKLFAPTPPLVAARYATSLCASSGWMPRESP